CSLLLFCALLLALTAHAQTLTAARVETVNFESKLVGQALPYHVVLPPNYDAPAARAMRYPVLYLLHGLAGSHDDWVSNRAHLAQHAAQYHIIIVTPEGHDGWYTDSATAPNEKYESYIVQELIPDVERRYRTLTTREARAIAGLSMGGYGALKFAVKYPERFVFAASMSGALGAPVWDLNDKEMIDFVKPSLARVYGAMDNPVRAANDIFKLYDALPPERIAQLPFIYLDCGTEDFLIDSNRAFDALLLKHKIPHEFRELPGKHEWPYWDQQVQEILRLAAHRLAAPHS
ncbi:MAG TPA: alpha/beta hydrolase family protein, partial [Pyrinomonadaceae bacterium]|nr:alpha/beta hydrolase family protein [Pyrinomonadaceae bacterium]